MEEGSVNINCNSRPSSASRSPLFPPPPRLSSQQRALNPNTLSDCSTHTYTHSRRKGWERDNRETTAVSYRKCITAWARAAERRRGSGGITAGLDGENARGRFLLLLLSVVNCPDLQGLRGNAGAPSSSRQNLDSSWFKNNPKSAHDSRQQGTRRSRGAIDRGGEGKIE